MIFGMDVASVDDNKDASWARAKAHGPISFAIVRASWGATPDGTFPVYWPALKATGLTRGAYMFLRFPRDGTQPDPPDKQAKACVEIVGELERTDLPIVLDVEFPGRGRVETGMSAQDALDWVRAAWNELRAAYDTAPIIYTSARVWKEDLLDLAADDLTDSPLWLARYYWNEKLPAIRDPAAFQGGQHDPPVPEPWGDATNWWIHQYQGDAVQLPGFSSTVDMNRFNATLNGDTGDRVRWLQRRMGIAESGTFDSATSAAVVAHQTQRALVPDGIVGPKTFASLCWP